VSKYLKRNWKLLVPGLVIVILVGAAFSFWRVSSFVAETTGGGRTEGFLQTTASNDLDPAPTLTGQISTTATSPVTILPTAVISPVVSSDPASLQKIKRGEPLTLLLAGYGGNDHAGQWLTDTILLLRYDPKTRTVLQLNIPRDLYVYIPYGGKDNGKWDKINTILPTIMEWDKPSQNSLDQRYRWTDSQKKFDSGINLLADTVETVVGFRIDYWATLSFDGFRRFVDAMGGVEMSVERYFVDRKYPRNDNDQIDASYKTIEFYPGQQRLSGERAIQYARSRFSETPGETGDFARSKRQMNLISAVRSQALKENLLLKLPDYMQALQGKIRFSLNFGEITALGNYFNSTEGKSLLTELKFDPRVLNDKLLEDKVLDEAYILVPLEGQGKYSTIQRWLRFAMLNAGSKTDAFKLQVLNGNGSPGIASKFTDFLIEQRFNMMQEQDGENRPDTVVFDYTMGKANSTVARLKTYLPDLKVIALLPSQRPKNVAPEIDLQLCLGKDFRMTALSGTTNTNNKGSLPEKPNG